MVENCSQCEKPGHLAKQCESRFHANGQFLGEQGNCDKTVKEGSVKTQAPSCPQIQACATSSQGELGGPLEFMFALPPPSL